MKNKDEKIESMKNFIKEGKIPDIKSLVKEGLDIHYGDDYFLYLAVFAKNEELQKYFIDIGLDPEVTKGRLAIAHPEDLEKIKRYKEEKEIKKFHKELHNCLPNQKNKKKNNKI